MMNKAESKARNELIKSAYQAGQTMKAIGENHGITYERVRQVLLKFNITGGQRRARTKEEKEYEHEIKTRKRILLTWGCTLEQYNYLRGMNKDYTKTPIYKFISQRNGAKKRGIEFYLTLWEWWLIWKESGKYQKRGRCYGEYVMCRNMDEGAYEVGNVFIATCSDNLATMGKPYSAENDWIRSNSLPYDELVEKHGGSF